MTHKEDYSSEFDIYLSDILDRLREKYGYASVNRMSDTAVIYYEVLYIYLNGKSPSLKKESITIPNSEIEDCIKSKTLPKEIQKLL